LFSTSSVFICADDTSHSVELGESATLASRPFASDLDSSRLDVLV